MGSEALGSANIAFKIALPRCRAGRPRCATTRRRGRKLDLGDTREGGPARGTRALTNFASAGDRCRSHGAPCFLGARPLARSGTAWPRAPVLGKVPDPSRGPKYRAQVPGPSTGPKYRAQVPGPSTGPK